MIRRLVALAACALPLIAGCAAPTDDGVETTSDGTEALTANGSTYILSSFDGTSQFMGFNNQGKTFTAKYAGTTAFKAAVLSKYFPTDPCRAAAASYNTAIGVNDTVGFNGALTSMAANSCMAKVLIDNTNTIKTFQPGG